MEISFVIVSYNDADLTINCINSIINQEYSDLCLFNIVVVDNSIDNYFSEIISVRFSEAKVYLLHDGNNYGYFGGLNKGLEYLSNIGFTGSIVICNNDLIFDISFLSVFKNNFQFLNKHYVISPFIINMSREVQNPHVIEKISFFREIVYDLYHSNFIMSRVILFMNKLIGKYFKRGDEIAGCNSNQFIYQGYGACYILSNKFLSKYKRLFNPSFLMYEEYFLSYQLYLKGDKVFYFNELKVNHMEHSSVNKISSKSLWLFSKSSHKQYRLLTKNYNKLQ